jgi:hypothetical protein
MVMVVVVVVEILEGHVILRYEDLFLRPPKEVWVFFLLLLTILMFFTGWVLLVP